MWSRLGLTSVLFLLTGCAVVDKFAGTSLAGPTVPPDGTPMTQLAQTIRPPHGLLEQLLQPIGFNAQGQWQTGGLVARSLQGMAHATGNPTAMQEAAGVQQLTQQTPEQQLQLAQAQALRMYRLCIQEHAGKSEEIQQYCAPMLAPLPGVIPSSPPVSSH